MRIKKLMGLSFMLKALGLVLLTSSWAYADTATDVDRVRWKKALSIGMITKIILNGKTKAFGLNIVKIRLFQNSASQQ